MAEETGNADEFPSNTRTLNLEDNDGACYGSHFQRRRRHQCDTQWEGKIVIPTVNRNVFQLLGGRRAWACKVRPSLFFISLSFLTTTTACITTRKRLPSSSRCIHFDAARGECPSSWIVASGSSLSHNEVGCMFFRFWREFGALNLIQLYDSEDESSPFLGGTRTIKSSPRGWNWGGEVVGERCAHMWDGLSDMEVPCVCPLYSFRSPVCFYSRFCTT